MTRKTRKKRARAMRRWMALMMARLLLRQRAKLPSTVTSRQARIRLPIILRTLWCIDWLALE